MAAISLANASREGEARVLAELSSGDGIYNAGLRDAERARAAATAAVAQLLDAQAQRAAPRGMEAGASPQQQTTGHTFQAFTRARTSASAPQLVPLGASQALEEARVEEGIRLARAEATRLRARISVVESEFALFGNRLQARDMLRSVRNDVQLSPGWTSASHAARAAFLVKVLRALPYSSGVAALIRSFVYPKRQATSLSAQGRLVF